MRGISCFVHILRDRNKLLRLKLTKLFPNINFSGEKDSGKVLIIIIILFLIMFSFKTLQLNVSYFGCCLCLLLFKMCMRRFMRRVVCQTKAIKFYSNFILVTCT